MMEYGQWLGQTPGVFEVTVSHGENAMKYANGKAMVWGFTLVFNLLFFSSLSRA
jgi:hypothetical protein